MGLTSAPASATRSPPKAYLYKRPSARLFKILIPTTRIIWQKSDWSYCSDDFLESAQPRPSIGLSCGESAFFAPSGWLGCFSFALAPGSNPTFAWLYGVDWFECPSGSASWQPLICDESQFWVCLATNFTHSDRPRDRINIGHDTLSASFYSF